MSASAKNGSAGENLRVCDAFAGETPALTANRLTETLKVYE